MANFFLIDQSLCQSGGHHADYARCIGRAATEMGFDTTIGANVDLSEPETLSELGNVQPVFRKTVYQRESYLAGLRHLTRAKAHPFAYSSDEHRSPMRRVVDAFRLRRHKAKRQKLIRSFAVDCEKLFRDSMFTSSDHALLTTVSEIELMGLAVYLANEPRTLQVQWHLQFHYNLFDGRTPEYGKQLTTARLVQSCFDAALSRVPYHSINFYTTSDTLVDQYERLGVGDFESLPYPVSSTFAANDKPTLSVFDTEGQTLGREERLKRDNLPSSPSAGPRPIRITCPGQLRNEKGFGNYLQPLVDKTWESYLATGKVEFVVQRPKQKWLSRRRLDIKAPGDATELGNAVHFERHPLPEQAYVDLIKSTDCGLLFYDSRVYFSRRAGVLGELMSCGKPVIVPAGSWLSDQIQPAIQQHVERVAADSRLIRELGTGQLDWDKSNVPLPGGIVSFDDRRHPFTIRFEPTEEESVFTCEFDWHWPDSHGVYCRLDVVQVDTHGNVTQRSQVVGRSRESARTSVMFNIANKAVSVEVSFRNAFHDSNASLRKLSVKTFDTERQRVPLGAVGIVVADFDQLPGAIAEFVDHREHYQASAKRQASGFSQRHDPKRTIARLLANDVAYARSA